MRGWLRFPRGYSIIVLLFLVGAAPYAQENDNPTIAILLIPGEGVSPTLESIVRESLALQLERYAFRIEQFPLEDLPEDDDGRYRVAERNGFDFALLTETRVEEETLVYRFSFIDIAGRREIARAEGRAAIGFTLDRVLQTVVYEVLERGIAALVRPVEFADAEREVEETGAAVAAGRPGGLRAIAATTVFLATGNAADYIDALPGTQLFVGWATPEAPFALGFAAGLYRGRATGEAVEARTALLPFGLEYRYTFGAGRVAAVAHVTMGGALLGLVTETRGEKWVVVPSLEVGAAARLGLRRGSAILLGLAQSLVYENSLVLTGLRPSLGVEFGL